jgi:hypothetical protein
LGLGSVPVPHVGERGVALPAVADHCRSGFHVGLDETRERGTRGIGNHLQPDPSRSAAPDLDGAHDERAVAQLTPAAKSFLVADVGLIDLNLANQAFAVGAEHGSAQLVEHRPRGLVPADAELTLELAPTSPACAW